MLFGDSIYTGKLPLEGIFSKSVHGVAINKYPGIYSKHSNSRVRVILENFEIWKVFKKYYSLDSSYEDVRDSGTWPWVAKQPILTSESPGQSKIRSEIGLTHIHFEK